MYTFLGIFNTVVFFSIALIHTYWALGGHWGISVVIPQISKKSTQNTFNPGPFATLIVAFIFVIWGCITASYVGYFTFFISMIPPQYIDNLSTIIAIILAFRAIGEFKYVGFFKKVNNTSFAFYDTRIYSPLCLTLSVFQFILVYKPF